VTHSCPENSREPRSEDCNLQKADVRSQSAEGNREVRRSNRGRCFRWPNGISWWARCRPLSSEGWAISPDRLTNPKPKNWRVSRERKYPFSSRLYATCWRNTGPIPAAAAGFARPGSRGCASAAAATPLAARIWRFSSAWAPTCGRRRRVPATKDGESGIRITSADRVLTSGGSGTASPDQSRALPSNRC
jgi:hypothetical protein